MTAARGSCAWPISTSTRSTTPPGREAELARIVGDEVYTNGIEAVRLLPELTREDA